MTDALDFASTPRELPKQTNGRGIAIVGVFNLLGGY